jgi:hypothetical protein
MTFDQSMIFVMYLGVASVLLLRKLFFQRSLLEELKSDATKRCGIFAGLLFLIGPATLIAPLATFTYIQGLGLSPFQFSAWLRTFEFFGIMFVALTPLAWGILYLMASISHPAFMIGPFCFLGVLVLLGSARWTKLPVYANILYLSLIVLSNIVVRVLCLLGMAPFG